MSVIPKYAPGQGIDFLGQQQSMMERAAASERDNAEFKMRQDQFQALLPVIAAKREADIASAQASIANATRMEEFRKQAATEAPKYNDEFLKANRIPDFQERARALADLQGRVSYMKILKEHRGFVDAVDNSVVQAHGASLVKMKLETETQRAQDALEGRQNIAEENNRVKLQLEDAKALHAKEIASLRASNEKEKVQVNADNKVRSAGSYKVNEAIMKSAMEAAPISAQIGTALTLLDDPDVRTGSGADFQVKAQRLGGLLGINVEGVDKSEQLQAILAESILEKARALKGSLSDKDLRFLESTSASMGKSREGNKRILLAYSKALNNVKASAQIISESRANGETEFETAQRVQNYVINNSIWADSTMAAAPSNSASTVGAKIDPPAGKEYPVIPNSREAYEKAPSGWFRTPQGNLKYKP